MGFEIILKIASIFTLMIVFVLSYGKKEINFLSYYYFDFPPC